ncbi:signal peptidase II [Mobilisporobacter senegalensis]|uniref:Lipoprotein signal peptidase n=1 Tax=Mobilisporobacter senegalensis TaxID=1329262 RepID=A0A3N1XW49_9FIRM|nr:signal peptidase II [Mobilisporobacter senegalensis]ROR29157.1 signal peptidase II [Mobilisporobacter senegalensis]
MKKFLALIWVIVLVIIDQYTKFLAKTNLENQDSIAIIKGVFELHYLENTGAAFGMLQDQILLFVIITIITILMILYLYSRIPYEKHFTPLRYILIFIIAGAIGNCIDRVVNRYVVDFLYFKLIDFPIFNVADCYVSISAVLLIILFLFHYKEEDLEFLNLKKVDKHE